MNDLGKWLDGMISNFAEHADPSICITCTHCPGGSAYRGHENLACEAKSASDCTQMFSEYESRAVEAAHRHSEIRVDQITTGNP